MSSIKTYTPTQQRELIREYAKQGTMRVSCLMFRKQDDVIQMCEDRAMGVGLERHGDQSWSLGLEQIELRTMKNLADAAFNQVVYSAIEAGAI
jgi:hypothetical protein